MSASHDEDIEITVEDLRVREQADRIEETISALLAEQRLTNALLSRLVLTGEHRSLIAGEKAMGTFHSLREMRDDARTAASQPLPTIEDFKV